MQKISEKNKLIYLLVILVPLIFVLVLTKHGEVFAASETYTWVNDLSIRVSGGDAEGSFEIKRSPGPSTNGVYVYRGWFHHKSGCDISSFAIGVSDAQPNAGVIQAMNVDVISEDGVNLCSSQIVSSYNNKAITIGGDRGGKINDEAPYQKKVSIMVLYALPRPQLPQSQTVEIKNASGATVTTTQATLNSSFDRLEGEVTLDPGTYSACAPNLPCVSFVKQIYVTGSVTIGESLEGRSVKVNVKMSNIARACNETITLNSIPLELKASDGRVVGSTSTGEIKIEPMPGEDEALSCSPNSNVSKSVVFQNIDPGQYQACIAGTNACVNVIKESGISEEVDLVVDGQNLSKILETYRGDNQEQEPTCEVKLNTPLSWLLCPVLNLADRVIGHFIEDTILNRLDFNIKDDAVKADVVWSGFRSLANIVFVIAFLVAIFGQATSFIDAYTIKKMLPRLVIAAITIQLSFAICELLVNATNVLGRGVGDLMAFPFGGMNEITLDLSSLSLGDQAGLFGGLLAASIGAFFGGFSLLGLALAAFFAVFGAILTIVFRETILYLLIVTSPIALVAWAIPNMDRLAKTWFSIFTKTLLMYPLIVAFITLGKILGGGKLGGVKEDTEALDAIVAVVLFFGPVFLVPFTYRFAGGAIATIGGFTGKLGQGAVAGAKKRAQAKGAERRAGLAMRAKSGGLLGNSPNSRSFRSKLNRGVAALGAGGGAWYRRARGDKRAISGAIETNAAIAAMARSQMPLMQALKTNDRVQALVAQSSNKAESLRIAKAYIDEEVVNAKKDGKSEAEVEAIRQRAEASWMGAHAQANQIGYTNDKRVAAATAWASSGYNFGTGEKAYERIQNTAMSIAGVDESNRDTSATYQNLMNNMQYNLKANAGRADLGGINYGKGYDLITGIDKVSDYYLGQQKADVIKSIHESIDKGENADYLLKRVAGAYAQATGAAKKEMGKILEQYHIEAPSGGNGPRIEQREEDQPPPDQI